MTVRTGSLRNTSSYPDGPCAPGENVLVQKTLTRDWQQLTALRTKPLTDKAMESFQLLASYDQMAMLSRFGRLRT